VVPHLIAALETETREGARWALVNCLGELGDPRAVEALAPLLENSDFQIVARDALARIVGRDLGPLPRDWLRWAEARALRTGRSPEEEAAGEAPPALSDRELVEKALEGSAANWQHQGAERSVVELPLAGGGSKEVTIVFGAEDHEGAQIVIVYADCGRASPAHYETVLRRNLRMPYGAVALRDIEGEPCFVMFNTILRHALSPVELRKSIFTVGERAHRVERQMRQ
jgi:hypothetical protein